MSETPQPEAKCKCGSPDCPERHGITLRPRQPEASGQALVERLRQARVRGLPAGDMAELLDDAIAALSTASPAPASPPLDDAGYALLEELRINANRLCDGARQHAPGGTYEQDCRRTLRKVDDYQKAAYLAGRGRQRMVQTASPQPPIIEGGDPVTEGAIERIRCAVVEGRVSRIHYGDARLLLEAYDRLQPASPPGERPDQPVTRKLSGKSKDYWASLEKIGKEVQAMPSWMKGGPSERPHGERPDQGLVREIAMRLGAVFHRHGYPMPSLEMAAEVETALADALASRHGPPTAPRR